MNNTNAENEKKICRHCGERLSVAEFPERRSASDGLSSWCRQCHRGNVHAVRRRRRERANEERSKAVKELNARLREQTRTWRARIARSPNPPPPFASVPAHSLLALTERAARRRPSLHSGQHNAATGSGDVAPNPGGPRRGPYARQRRDQSRRRSPCRYRIDL